MDKEQSPLNKRQADIMNAVNSHGACSIGELARKLDVTTETIRRNIRPLMERGRLIKYHGGVMLPAPVEEPPFQKRMEHNRAAKQKAAGRVARDLSDGDSIMLDTGSTTTYVAQALGRHSQLLVVTNSAQIACWLAPSGRNNVFMVGGELRADDAAAFGNGAHEFIRQFRVKYAVLSIGGISDDGKLMDFHLCEAEFSRAVMAQAEQVWVVADHSKFGLRAPVSVCNLADIDAIYTDRPPSSAFRALCQEADVRIASERG